MIILLTLLMIWIHLIILTQSVNQQINESKTDHCLSELIDDLVQYQIFSFFNIGDIEILSFVSTKWNELAHDQTLRLQQCLICKS